MTPLTKSLASAFSGPRLLPLAISFVLRKNCKSKLTEGNKNDNDRFFSNSLPKALKPPFITSSQNQKSWWSSAKSLERHPLERVTPSAKNTRGEDPISDQAISLSPLGKDARRETVVCVEQVGKVCCVQSCVRSLSVLVRAASVGCMKCVGVLCTWKRDRCSVCVLERMWRRVMGLGRKMGNGSGRLWTLDEEEMSLDLVLVDLG